MSMMIIPLPNYDKFGGKFLKSEKKCVGVPLIKTALRLILHQKSGDKRFLFSAFQKGVSNPLIKTALRLLSAKITLKVAWINAPK